MSPDQGIFRIAQFVQILSCRICDEYHIMISRVFKTSQFRCPETFWWQQHAKVTEVCMPSVLIAFQLKQQAEGTIYI